MTLMFGWACVLFYFKCEWITTNMHLFYHEITEFNHRWVVSVVHTRLTSVSALCNYVPDTDRLLPLPLHRTPRPISINVSEHVNILVIFFTTEISFSPNRITQHFHFSKWIVNGFQRVLTVWPYHWSITVPCLDSKEDFQLMHWPSASHVGGPQLLSNGKLWKACDVSQRSLPEGYYNVSDIIFIFMINGVCIYRDMYINVYLH